MGERGGPSAADLDATGQRPAGGVPPTDRRAAAAGTRGEVRPAPTARLPHILSDQPWHHHSSLRSHQAAQNRCQRKGDKGHRQPV